jgi:hypothetical protein
VHRFADQVDQGQAGSAAGEIKQRHLDRRVRAGVADQGGAQARRQHRPLPGILADQHGRQMVAHGGQKAAARIAGHRRGRGGLAPADCAVGRLDAHEEVVGRRDGDARHAHRLLQRQRDRDCLDVPDEERRPRVGVLGGAPARRRDLNMPGHDARNRTPSHYRYVRIVGADLALA